MSNAGPVGGAREAEVEALLDGCRRSHARLAEVAGALEPGSEQKPSELPGWTVGHLLTHLARNADSQTWMAEGALAGEVRHQYPGGMERRNADIEAGAGRPLAALVDDVRESAARLEAAWGRMTPEAWEGSGVNAAGITMSCPDLVFARVREVEVHLVDLGVGYSPADWPDHYVAGELPRLLAQVPLRLDGPGLRAFTAWLLERDGLPAGFRLGPWQPPGPPR